MQEDKFNPVYVLNKDGTPLMPTTRYGKVRRMLRDKTAEIVSYVPFTIRLKAQIENPVTQPVCLGIDPGRTNIGTSAVREDGTCLYSNHTTTANKDVKRHMDKRRTCRRASRRGERLRRKRRAKQHDTMIKAEKKTRKTTRVIAVEKDGEGKPVRFALLRKLPGCEKNSIAKDIINTEARFNNRKRPKGWVTPTVEQLVRTHVNEASRVSKILPVSSVAMEVNKFAFMALEDPSIWQHKWDFQNGPLKGHGSVEKSVFAMQNGVCLLCGKAAIEEYHHMKPRYEFGSDTFPNIAGLCKDCHYKIHHDEKAMKKLRTLHTERNKKYAAVSALNQAIPRISERLSALCADTKSPIENMYAVMGWETKTIREHYQLPKEHEIDAYCIALCGMGYNKDTVPTEFPLTHETQQFRRHNRANIHSQTDRTYKLEGKTVAKNRHKRTSQTENGKVKAQSYDSLAEWYAAQKELVGETEARKLLSKLKVLKSTRRYNPDPETRQFAPGDAVLYDGKRYIVTGQQHRGEYLIFMNGEKPYYKAHDCRRLQKNCGLVYIN